MSIRRGRGGRGWVQVFLACDEAAFITGEVIFADGGASVGI